ncbi:hypothetical protein CLOM_g16562 [Closterium sp. NIES-68]|nr:hypothetical protein CLOM_g16562 [Closterium sp. NIES-68]GJP69304.1 hypothetical protein CLOP_g243 [Closterium sp. NIES-67]
MDFQELEAAEGVRFSWNVWPATRLDATRCVVPFGAIFTPLADIPDLQLVPHPPLLCKACGAALNPYCALQFGSRSWACSLCQQRNLFPPNYRDISETNLPIELSPSLSTIEFLLPHAATPQPAFLFLLDTCVPADELHHMKAALLRLLPLLPVTCPIGLITVGAQVAVHELSHSLPHSASHSLPHSTSHSLSHSPLSSRVVLLPGEKDLSASKIKQLLGLPVPRSPYPPPSSSSKGAHSSTHTLLAVYEPPVHTNAPGKAPFAGGSSSPKGPLSPPRPMPSYHPSSGHVSPPSLVTLSSISSASASLPPPLTSSASPPPSLVLGGTWGADGRYLVPLVEGEAVLRGVIGALQPDSQHVMPGCRPRRAIGAALAAAVAVMEVRGELVREEGGRAADGAGWAFKQEGRAAGDGRGASEERAGGARREGERALESGGRVVVLLGGPCTVGPGMVVGSDMADCLRTHSDILLDNTTYYHRATRFYSQLGERAAEVSAAIDVFACAADQVGVAEMRGAIEATSGTLVLAESFESDIFAKSLCKLFQRSEAGHLLAGTDGVVEVKLPREVKVMGAVGACGNLWRKGAGVSEHEVGQGGTAAWRLCSLSPRSSSLAFFFEIAPPRSHQIPDGSFAFFQFLTTYRHGDGSRRVRVATAARRWVHMGGEGQGGGGADRGDAGGMAQGEGELVVGGVPGGSAAAALLEVVMGFDQEAAAALVAKLAAFKAESEDMSDVLRWLDRMLIRFGAKFGQYSRGDPSSFHLSSAVSLFPQFMFHLRRSSFLQVFNHSPDETAFFRLMLTREAVTNSLLMVQPTLIAYTFDAPPHPVLLDVSSLQPDCVLLYDGFFHVVVLHGSTIVHWKHQGFHLDPAHAAFRKLLELPMEDAFALARERMPEPRIMECEQGSSQSRFLTSRLNPSTTHTSSNIPSSPSFVEEATHSQQYIFTDDVSLETFSQHLQRLAVQ